MAGGLAVVVLVLLAAQLGRGTPAAGPGTASATPGAGPMGSGSIPDLANMSPRERADRLFNRIMQAHEQGDAGQISFFKPMAVQSYEMLGTLDADARYHLGLIHAVTGDLAAATIQLDSLAQEAPAHLLGSMLRHSIAQMRGDQTAARDAYEEFLANYATEANAGRQEYDDHARAIETFRQEAQRAMSADGS